MDCKEDKLLDFSYTEQFDHLLDPESEGENGKSGDMVVKVLSYERSVTNNLI